MSKSPNKAPEYSGKGVETNPSPKMTFYDPGQEWKTFVWNPKTKEFLGRTALSWGKIGVFYVFYYAFLAAFFAFMMTVLLHTIEEDRPKYTSHGGESVLKAPGIGMRPDYRPYDESYKLVEYDPQQDDPDNDFSYLHFAKSINDLLRAYNDSMGPEETPGCKTDVKDPCGFSLKSLGNPMSTENDTFWGYNSNSPTIILKLNKVFDWVPQTYDSNSGNLPVELLDYINNNTETATSQKMVWVWCTTKVEGVRLDYSPYPGFPVFYYPFYNQKGFLSPLVAVHVQNLTVGTDVRMSCKAYAKNTKDQSLEFILKVKSSE